MKFTQTDIPKMAIAAAVSGLIVFLLLFRPTPPDPPQDDARLSWNEALNMIAEYKKTPISTGGFDSQGKPVKIQIQGFKMNAANINEILNHNLNGINGNKTADELMIYFGIDTRSGVRALQLIAIGVEKGQLMRNVNPTDKMISSVFDRADPCPPNCPK